jgi:S-adenosylmethionine hydrolase
MDPFVHLIADYGKADPAFSEVVHRLKDENRAIDVQTTAVRPFSTIATGFWIEQLGVHNPAFEGLTIYSNTAPRAEDSAPRRSNEGEGLCYLELDNGVPVLAINGGYNLSFVRDHVREFRAVDAPREGSQFRSRDFFPARVAEIAAGDVGSLGEELSIETIPSKPDAAVCHVDGYGNLKTSIRDSEFDSAEERVTVEIDSRTRTALYRDAVFEVGEGNLVVAPGSAGGEDAYLEIVQRGGSAAQLFDDPSPGETISFR